MKSVESSASSAHRLGRTMRSMVMGGAGLGLGAEWWKVCMKGRGLLRRGRVLLTAEGRWGEEVLVVE